MHVQQLERVVLVCYSVAASLQQSASARLYLEPNNFAITAIRTRFKSIAKTMADENNMTDQSPPIQAQFAKGALEKIPQEIRDMIYTYAFIPETPHFCFHIKQRDDQVSSHSLPSLLAAFFRQ